MIRPCDQCDGAGQQGHPVVMMGHRDGCGGETCDRTCPIPVQGGDEIERCDRCADMPTVICPNAIIPGPEGGWMHPGTTCDLCQISEYVLWGNFRPDPDAVMRWCFEHSSPVDYGQERCSLWMLDAIQDLEDEACFVGWVERPTPLEETE